MPAVCARPGTPAASQTAMAAAAAARTNRDATVDWRVMTTEDTVKSSCEPEGRRASLGPGGALIRPCQVEKPARVRIGRIGVDGPGERGDGIIEVVGSDQ